MRYDEFLSKRNICMAFAILWIMLFHMQIISGIVAVDAIINIGYAGSDIFYFVSGIGIWFSLEKSESLGDYFKKRFIRVVPMWWCFIGFWIYFRMKWFGLTPFQAVANVFMVESFFDIDSAFNWYIPFLMVFYLVAPAIKRIMEIIPAVLCLIIVCVVVFVLGFFVVESPDIMIGFTRFPVFVMGMYMGCRMYSDPGGRFSVPELVVWILLAPVGLYLTYYFGRDFLWGWHNGLIWYPLVLSTPGLCMAISLLSKVLPDAWSKPFMFIGRHTLSIYFVHIFIFEIYTKYLVGFSYVTPVWWHYIILLALVPLGCAALEMLTGMVTGLFTKKPLFGGN